MKRMSSLAITFMVSIMAVALATAGYGGPPLQTAAAKSPAPGSAANPCAAKASNPGAAKAQPCSAKAAQPCAANPCAAKNPCASQNPCNAKQASAAKPAVAKMIKAEIVAADPARQLLSVRHDGQDLSLRLDRLTAVRQGPTRVTLEDLQPGRAATVSYVERDGQRTAKYVYLAAATAAN